MVKTKKYKKKFAAQLFSIAQNDLIAAETLEKNPQVRPETVLLLVQQCVEKALKAVLCWYEIPIPLTHDLYLVLECFEADKLPPGGEAITDLTPYASIRRYEEGMAEISPDDVQLALETARQIIFWGKKELDDGKTLES